MPNDARNYVLDADPDCEVAMATAADRVGRYELRRTARGHPFNAWTPDVTRVPDEYQDISVYLYPSPEAAEAGADSGGSGFLVEVPSEAHQGVSYAYGDCGARHNRRIPRRQIKHTRRRQG